MHQADCRGDNQIRRRSLYQFNANDPVMTIFWHFRRKAMQIFPSLMLPSLSPIPRCALCPLQLSELSPQPSPRQSASMRWQVQGV